MIEREMLEVFIGISVHNSLTSLSSIYEVWQVRERERQEKVVKRKRGGPRDAAKKAKWAIIIIDPYFPLSIIHLSLQVTKACIYEVGPCLWPFVHQTNVVNIPLSYVVLLHMYYQEPIYYLHIFKVHIYDILLWWL